MSANIASIEPKSQLPSISTSLTEVTDKLPIEPPCRIFFKNEYEQPSGSFKLRGIGYLIHESLVKAKQLYPNKKPKVFASSGGNAGLAAAYSAKFYGVSCTVVVPTITKPEVIDLLNEYGAEAIMYGETIYEAEKFVKLLMKDVDSNKVHLIYCHPFDDPLIWKGHSPIVDEIVQQQLSKKDVSKLKGTVLSVGGGGLYNGICYGLKQNNHNSPLLLIETKQAPTFTETIKAGKIITLNSVKSLATSLACSYVSKQSLSYYQDQLHNKTYVESVDDLDAVKGSIDYYEHFNKAVEPACGASLSVVFDQLHLLTKNFKNLQKDDILVVVVCGGSCTNETGIQNFKTLIRQQVKL